MDEQPIRCWIHPELKQALERLYNTLNKVSIEKTNYPIPKGLPLSSKIAAKILNRVLESKKTLILATKVENKTLLKLNILKDLKKPIIFLISFGEGKIIEKDNNYLNIKLHKKIGIKKNEIFFR